MKNLLRYINDCPDIPIIQVLKICCRWGYIGQLQIVQLKRCQTYHRFLRGMIVLLFRWRSQKIIRVKTSPVALGQFIVDCQMIFTQFSHCVSIENITKTEMLWYHSHFCIDPTWAGENHAFFRNVTFNNWSHFYSS